MRVAFSGAHRTGKTTLIGSVAAALPAYAVVDEPYHLLEEDGHELSDPPSPDDFALQLRRSLDLLSTSPADVLFDRCPLDFLAYLAATDPDFDPADALDDIRRIISRLDLILAVPIETPDRIPVPAEDRRLRRRVDALLLPLLLDDPHAFEIPTIEVHGTLAARTDQVLRAMRVP